MLIPRKLQKWKLLQICPSPGSFFRFPPSDNSKIQKLITPKNNKNCRALRKNKFNNVSKEMCCVGVNAAGLGSKLKKFGVYY